MFRVLLYLLILGAVIYTVFWAISRRNAGPDAGGAGPTAAPPRGPVGPDDDEDFLRELDRKRRHRDDQSGG